MIQYENQRVLVISPHQDDLEVGCGGLVQKFIAADSLVFVAHGTIVNLDGVYKKFDKSSNSYVEYTGKTRLEETKAALRTLGGVSMLDPLFESIRHHRLDTIPLSDSINVLENVVLETKPTLILVTAVSTNQDHEALNRAVRSIMRPHFYNGVVLEYEIGDELSFKPNLYVPLSREELEKKIKAFKCYGTQQSGDLHIVSLSGMKSKAEYRGKQCYHEYAEAFSIVRMVL